MPTGASRCSTFQADEIEAAKLKPGEDDELRKERDRLANAESLAQYAQQALTVLDEGTPESPAASDLVGQAAQAMHGLAKIDAGQSDLAEPGRGPGRHAGRTRARPARLSGRDRIQPASASRKWKSAWI